MCCSLCPTSLLCPGGTVSIGPGVGHWPGATAGSLFTHLAIDPNASRGVAAGPPPVRAEEYQAAPQ